MEEEQLVPAENKNTHQIPHISAHHWRSFRSAGLTGLRVPDPPSPGDLGDGVWAWPVEETTQITGIRIFPKSINLITEQWPQQCCFSITDTVIVSKVSSNKVQILRYLT